MDMPVIPGIRRANTDRPPGALDEDPLRDTCPGCGDFVDVCPTQIIELDLTYLPYLTAAQDCTECGLCVDVCMFGVLHHTPETQAGLNRILQQERKG